MGKVVVEIHLESSDLDAAIKKLERLKELSEEVQAMPCCKLDNMASALANKIAEEVTK